MRVLFILGLPNPFSGAAWSRIGFFAEEWASKTNQVDVVGTFTYKSINARGARRLGKTNIFNIIPHMVSSHPFFFAVDTLISALVIRLFLFAKKPKIAIISVPPGDAGLGAIIACKMSGTRYVVDIRDEWEDYEIDNSQTEGNRKAYNWIKTLMTKILQRSRLVVTVTKAFAKKLRLRGIKNVERIPNGANINVFVRSDKEVARQKLGLNTNDYVIVYDGLIGAYYQLDVILRAITKLEPELRNKTKMLIIGSGPDLPRILRIAKVSGLENNVLYLGNKNRTEVAEALSASDVGVIPGLYSKGQLPVKFFEYSACEIPTIAVAPPDSLLSTIIRKNNVGLTSAPTADDELAEAIVQIYENKAFRDAAGKRAKALIEKEFDRNKIAEKYAETIKEYFDLNINNE